MVFVVARVCGWRNGCWALKPRSTQPVLCRGRVWLFLLGMAGSLSAVVLASLLWWDV
ncbi:hypothetical protein PSEUDO8Z_120047 [Pseudomonas sp. 8Z]|nr:hypothetical protein PSEUDO8Z_120047 [Pseudomonas sp. 8Z]